MSFQQSQNQCQTPPKCPSLKSTAQCLPAASSCCATTYGGFSAQNSERGSCLSHQRRRSHRCRSSSSCDHGSGQQSEGLGCGHSSGGCC
ncbi:late cornified envelope protein 3B-like [Arvicanthis niloticus]|uniref:late cornified envelope protein 3B-like n=1 Tax=Arvicanthis niloticus TaxID=61156 RepID=UPI0014871185|nr:late cornified envelope protein 3A-like [Arvicanthis niloticus]